MAMLLALWPNACHMASLCMAHHTSVAHLKVPTCHRVAHAYGMPWAIIAYGRMAHAFGMPCIACIGHWHGLRPKGHWPSGQYFLLGWTLALGLKKLRVFFQIAQNGAEKVKSFSLFKASLTVFAL